MSATAPATAETVAPQPGIMEIALYEAGASHVAGHPDPVKLSSNENPWGCSPAAQAAIEAAAAAAHRYPSSDHAGLRAAIGEVHGLDPARIICGAGSDEIISWLAHAYAGPGTEVLFTEHGFLMYRIAAQTAGATPVAVRERERVTDVDALIAGATPATRLVFVANPNNPTGTMIPLAELERLARAVPQAIVALDSAYAEFAEGYDGGAEIASRLPNVVMLRTFSKIHGLGGLRVGWAYGPRAVIDVLARMRGPFNVSAPGLAAAEAAIRDTAFTERCRAETARLRDRLADALAAAGVPSDPSFANFILARFPDRETAEACDAALQADGLIVRRVAGYGLPNCLRITIGDEVACRRVAESVRRFMAGRGA
ncbi:histidinol-phosphate transaminase [Paracoccus sp. S-4012]|uniref:histidinol-phosphate transaminase n=1 Tax=Paracoccus sp. S-4012 TaxID=2665648 RepID=UPI0012B144D5|nr:histidinol-phosphate transaminase [Paracoccus sp. S-4012]MRX50133.1 histidinol-phosphate transaminase [Paracoccus sp. S-4012]